MAKLTVADIQRMKRDGVKIAAAITYDYQQAQILDRVGIDVLTVGDSIGRNRFGQPTHHETTVDLMVLACGAVSRGAKRALVNCDMPFGPPQEGPDAAVRAAIRLVKEGHAEMVKIDNAVANLDSVRAIVKTGIPVWTQFGFSPQSTLRIGSFDNVTEEDANRERNRILEEARLLEEIGASMLDLTHVKNPEIYAEVSRTVSIPILGGSSHAGPEADGRITGFTYSVANLDGPPRHGLNLAKVMFDGAEAYIKAVREARRY